MSRVSRGGSWNSWCRNCLLLKLLKHVTMVHADNKKTTRLVRCNQLGVAVSQHTAAADSDVKHNVAMFESAMSTRLACTKRTDFRGENHSQINLVFDRTNTVAWSIHFPRYRGRCHGGLNDNQRYNFSKLESQNLICVSTSPSWLPITKNIKIQAKIQDKTIMKLTKIQAKIQAVDPGFPFRLTPMTFALRVTISH